MNASIQVGVASSLTNFVGFISSTPLVSVTFLRTSTITNQFPNVDDLAGAQGVPEPGSIALTVAGLATLLALRKHR